MAAKVAGSTPPGKSQTTAGAGKHEETTKKSTTAWGVVTVSVGLQGRCFSSFVLLVLVMFAVAVVSVTLRRISGSGAELLSTVPPTAAFLVTRARSNSAAAELPTVPPPPPTAAAAADGGGRDVEECDLSSGRWVYNPAAYPLYEESACRFNSDNSCGKNGRTDLRYQHWRWQPHGCDLPRFEAATLLEKLRDKRLAFVGDSLNRNQWVSMVCLIDTATPGLHKTLNTTGALFSFHVHEYNASVDFYWSPLLVDSNSDHPVHHRAGVIDRTVRAGSIVEHARHWTNADVLVFNSYLWWRHFPTIKVRWGPFDAAYGVSKAVGGLRAFELALTTWADWLEFNVDRARTRLFFMSLSPTHIGSGRDNDHGCYNETEPLAAADIGSGDHGLSPAFARALEEQVRRLGARGVAVRVVNVTGMSEWRRDAHPSVHRRQWGPPTEAQRRWADCIHWCLPGVPDVWNQLLYAHIVE